LPVAFSIYGPNILYVAPAPNVDYPRTEFDTAIIPDQLIFDNTNDIIPEALHRRREVLRGPARSLRMQQYEEALAFDKLYTQRTNELNAVQPAAHSQYLRAGL
jgi:hypothetical protein